MVPVISAARASVRRSSSAARILAGIVIGAALLRLVPIWFGLPYPEARPDEETALAHALDVLLGHANPHFFHWPSLIFYLFALALSAASAARRVLGLDPTLTGNEQYLVARAVVALAGTATVWVVYRIARRVDDSATGIVAALFLAVAILHVRESHFAMTDVVMTLLVTGSLALLLHAVGRDGAPPDAARWFAAAGLAGGLAASTKYNAAAVLAAMAAAQAALLADRRRWRDATAWVPAGAFTLAFTAGFLGGTPYALLDYREFIQGVRFDMTHLSAGQGVMLGRGWTYHLGTSLPYGLGIPIFVAAIVGVAVALQRHRRAAAILGSFAVALYVSLGNGYTVFMRYVLPLVPVACVAAAIGVRRAAAALAAATRLDDRRALAVLAAGVAIVPLVNCIRFDALLARTDTRVLAAEWLSARVGPDATLYDAGNVYTALAFVPGHRWVYDPASKSFVDAAGRIPDWLIVPASPLSIYTAAPAGLQELARRHYVLAHVVRATRGDATVAPRGAVYDLQDAFFLPVAGFSGIERPGPTVFIYHRAAPADFR